MSSTDSSRDGLVLGVVPARGGSKGIAGKNLAPLAGRPLLAYTADAVHASRTLDRTIVSTDDDGIAEAAADLGLEVPFIRPRELARDDTPMLDVLAHALAHVEGEGQHVAALALLQPTSPLRTAEDIDAAVGALWSSAAQSVVTVVRVPHHFVPEGLYRRAADGTLESLAAGPALTRRQDKPELYARNGPAVLVTRPSVIRSGKLYGEPTVGVVMRGLDSLDIDTLDDLELVAAVLQRRGRATRA